MVKWFYMDPNQQPHQPPQQPQPGSVPPQPTPQQGYTAPSQQPQPLPQPGFPQPPSAYQAPTAPQPFDPNYLDSIAPPPPKPALFSGSFGKIFFAMIFLFVIAVSIIVAASGQDKTADLQHLSVRLDNTQKVAKEQQKNFRSNNLKNLNSDFTAWLAGNFGESETLLQEGGVKKTQYDKKMVAEEKELADELKLKFEEARLNAKLNQTYANSMASQTEEITAMLNSMSKRSQSAKIREYAKRASENLKPIQERFQKYNDDGSN